MPAQPSPDLLMQRPLFIALIILQTLPALLQPSLLAPNVAARPCRATPTRSAAYHFTYMIPQANKEVLQRYNDKGVPFESILPIGAAPCTAALGLALHEIFVYAVFFSQVPVK